MSTIIIGLGSTGRGIVEKVRQLHLQFTGTAKPDDVDYLSFDTENAPNKDDDITKVWMSLRDAEAQIPILRQIQGTEWIPTVDYVRAVTPGLTEAAAISTIGRLALWMNWNRVQNALTGARQRVRGNENTNVFIVGALTGGTCTGSFIDLAYLCKQSLATNKIYGMFLIPGEENAANNRNERSPLENYLMAISSLKYYSTPQNTYTSLWPNIQEPYIDNARPYEQTWFLSFDYSTGANPMTHIADLARVAALNLCNRIIDNGAFDEHFGHGALDVRARQAANADNYIYSTFGTKVIYYPHAQLTEWFGLDLCEEDIKGRLDNGELKGGWINSVNYIDKNANKLSVTGNRSRINNELNAEFEKVLYRSLTSIDNMSVVRARSMEEAIENEIKKGLDEKKDIYGLIYGLFDMNKSENFYCHVLNNRNTIRDNLVEGLTSLVNENLKKYKNLFLIKNWLKDDAGAVSLTKNINNILAFWEMTYNLDGTPESYVRFLNNEVDYVVEKIKLPSFVLQKKDYLKEQTKNLYMLCKMHFTISILEDVRNSIGANIADATLNIPTLAKVDNCIDKLTSVLNDREKICIYTRKNELDAEMTPSTHFVAIFNSSRDEDKQNIRNKYDRDVAHNAKFKLKGLSGDNPWRYLTETTRDNIFNDCVDESKRYVMDNNLVDAVWTNGDNTLQDNSIQGIILRLKNNRNPQYDGIRRCIEGTKDNIVPNEIPGLIALRRTNQAASTTALSFYIGETYARLFYSTTNIDNFKQILSENVPVDAYVRSLSVETHNCSPLPSLRQAVILYYDYGLVENGLRTFNPVTDIDINRTVKNLVLKETVISNRYRYPYLDKEKLEEILSLI